MVGLSAFVLAAQLGAAPGAPDSPTAVQAQAPAAQAPAPAPESMPMFGGKLDVGLPDGVGVSLLVRPWPWVRLEGGLLENGVAPGLRGGVTLMPIRWWITPVLTGEAGYYFPGNANKLVEQVSHNPSFNSGFLNDIHYDFLNAHVGLEIGSSRRFCFFLHGGFTHIDFYDQSFGAGLSQVSKGQGFTGGTAAAHLNTWSAKLGFVFFIG